MNRPQDRQAFGQAGASTFPLQTQEKPAKSSERTGETHAEPGEPGVSLSGRPTFLCSDRGAGWRGGGFLAFGLLLRL